MRTSWRRLPHKGNTMTSWKEAYQTRTNPGSVTVDVLYEDVTAGVGDSLEEAKDDFLENIRLKITELSEMLEYCAKNQPRLVK